MDLIVNEVVKLQIIHNADGNGVIKRLTRTSVIKDRLAVFGQTCLLQAFFDIRFVCTVKDRCHDLPAEVLGGDAEVHFQNLTDVHT